MGLKWLLSWLPSGRMFKVENTDIEHKYYYYVIIGLEPEDALKVCSCGTPIKCKFADYQRPVVRPRNHR